MHRSFGDLASSTPSIAARGSAWPHLNGIGSRCHAFQHLPRSIDALESLLRILDAHRDHWISFRLDWLIRSLMTVASRRAAPSATE
jgi:hypothetical protein